MLTVITPALSYRLTSEVRARDQLQLSVEAVPGPYLLDLIDAASFAIANHCNRAFARETVTETVRPCGSGPLILSRAPVVGDVAVLLDGNAVTPDTMECNRSAGLLYRLDGWRRSPWYGRSAVVTYTAGWILPEDSAFGTALPADRLPADVEQACLTLVAARIAGRGRDPMLRSESTEGVGSASYIATADMGAMPPQATAALAPYLRMGFA
jgi:hypothetical protein